MTARLRWFALIEIVFGVLLCTLAMIGVVLGTSAVRAGVGRLDGHLESAANIIREHREVLHEIVRRIETLRQGVANAEGMVGSVATAAENVKPAVASLSESMTAIAGSLNSLGEQVGNVPGCSGIGKALVERSVALHRGAKDLTKALRSSCDTLAGLPKTRALVETKLHDLQDKFAAFDEQTAPGCLSACDQLRADLRRTGRNVQLVLACGGLGVAIIGLFFIVNGLALRRLDALFARCGATAASVPGATGGSAPT